MESFSSYRGEEYIVACDFSATGKLPSGTSVSTCTVEITDLVTERVDNTIVSNTSATVADNVARVERIGGEAGRKYLFVFNATLSDGSILKEPVIHRVSKLI